MDINHADQMLLELLTQRKNIVGFLDSIFGFLSRCTDFYYVKNNPEDGLGFISGAAEKAVLESFKKYRKFGNVNSIEDEKKVIENEKHIIENVQQEITVHSEECVPEQNNSFCDKHSFKPSEYYNGAQFDNYCWSQNINDLDIYIKLPKNITNSKQISIDITSNHIKIINRISNEAIIDERLNDKCKSSETIWTIISENKLQITLEKHKEIWWNKLFLKENPINLKDIDCSRDIEEYSEESQAAIEKLRWDQEQKLCGKPTSEELNKMKILKQAWNVEGSPFKGQPFNPSLVKFD